MQANPTRWPMFKRALRHAELMDRMLDASNIDIVAAARADRGRAIARARTRCLQCHAEGRCQAWLNASSTPHDLPAFCPSAKFFQEFIRKQVEHSKTS